MYGTNNVKFTQFPVQRALGGTDHVPMFRMGGAVPSLLNVFVACTGITLHLVRLNNALSPNWSMCFSSC
jgi:hypothetical protein